ncbi:MAG: hemerythrin family protein [Anaeromyxobacteraceae bacterium]
MEAVVTVWTSALELGIAEIDLQHQELFRCVARIRDAAFAGDPAELDRTVAFLAGYVELHFAAEERYMAAQRYPGLARHREEHAWLLQAVREIEAEHRRDGPSSSALARAERFLSDWLRSHIGVTDLAMARFVRRARPG